MIKVVSDINDLFLASEWQRLDREANTFPQMTYEWCATWWKYMSDRRQLNIVVVENENGQADAIVPLCIEKTLGIKVLRSFPVQFGDFYDFIVSPTADKNTVFKELDAYFKSNQSWHWVRLQLAGNNSFIRKELFNYDYHFKRMNGCVIVDFEGLTWDEYFSKLKRKHRENVRNRLRRIEKEFRPVLKCITEPEEFELVYPELRNLYLERISDDGSVRSSTYEIMLHEALGRIFVSGNALLFILYFDSQIAAFNYGFQVERTYYTWHASANPAFYAYHPSVMMFPFLIKWLINNGFSKMNRMAGDYSWKKDWSISENVEDLYLITSPSNNLQSYILNLYFHNLRDKVKLLYRWLVSFDILRPLRKYKENQDLNAREVG